MKNYQLAPNEVRLIQTPITLKTEKGAISAEIILTDLNFIFVTPQKNFLWIKRKDRHVAFAKETVKIYQDTPQIKQTNTSVSIQFTTEDRVIEFETKKDARTFVIKAWEVITGKNLLERYADKLKDALDFVDEKFDINIVALVKDAVTVGLPNAIVGGVNSKAKKWFSRKKDTKSITGTK